MNKDKVYLKGYAIGRAADTLGYEGLMVQLENLDVVEIDKSLVHKKIDEPQLIKLKDVIARIKSLDVGTQEVWLNKILKELGSDYGSLKYRAGYEQGRFDCAMERDKVTVPQYVADWIEKGKKELSLRDLMSSSYTSTEVGNWLGELDEDGGFKNQETFARAVLDGYTVEKEKRYIVKLKGINSESEYLYYGMGSCTWRFREKNESGYFRKEHTRKELEEAGFGEMFNSPLFEVEEVEE